MRTSPNPLECALREWEDLCFLQGVAVRANRPNMQYGFEGPLRHWREFRRFVLGCNKDQKFDLTRFLGRLPVQELVMPVHLLPMALTSWTTSSRRIFHVSPDLQALLEATSLGDMLWEDVPWPFESFLVTMESPLRDPFGNTYDAILVSRGYRLDESSESMMIEFRMLSTKLGKRKHLIPELRKKFEQALQQGRTDRVGELLRQNVACSRISVTSIFFLNHDSRQRVADSVSETVQVQGMPAGFGIIPWGQNPPGSPNPHWDKAALIVVGLCAYLTTLGSGGTHDRSDWERIPAGVDPNAITSGAEVCTVKASRVITALEAGQLRDALDQEEDVEQGRGGGQAVRCHFRRGTWRRWPGQGNNPMAPKLVHQRPTIVRRDRLPEGGVPGGSENIVE